MRVSELRPLFVLPGKKMAENSTRNVTAITIDDPKFFKENKWWKYEKYLGIHFGEEKDDDITKYFPAICSECSGECCKDIPSHNLRMYISEGETKRLIKLGYNRFIDNYIIIEGEKFGVLKVKENGDCHFLTETGCKLKEDRPLWCKVFVCEKIKKVIENEGYVQSGL